MASEIEFLSLVEGTLLDGNVISMSDLHNVYLDISAANNVENPHCRRKVLKKLIQNAIPNVELNKPKRANESGRVTIKSIRDAAVQTAEETSTDCDADVKVLYNAASILRKAISKAKKKKEKTIDSSWILEKYNR